MKQTIYVVVSLYNHKHQSGSQSAIDLVATLRKLGEVNVFALPNVECNDSVECDDNLRVHHYACSEKEIANATQRLTEMVRDMVQLGATECYIDYGVSKEYQALLRSIYTALRTYGIPVHIFNKRVPFRWIRNLIWDIKFQLNEWKLQEQEEKEIEQVEGFSRHGSIHGFVLYKKFDTAREERKRIHELRKHH